MKKLITSIFLCLFSFSIQAKIEVTIEPSSINLDEAFKLSLIQNETQNPGIPDLSVLQKDFKILGTERNVSYTIINGQTASSSQWVILLKAKKAGIVTLPAIKIGLESTDPLTINVDENPNLAPTEKTSSYATQTEQAVFLNTEVSNNKPYVNQQITLKVSLNASKQLFNAQYRPPEVQDALVIPLGKERQYQKILNNRNYIIEEQKYAIFPQKSGPLKIKSPTFTALSYDFDSTDIRLKNKDIILSVQPIPKAYQNKDWLPAKKIQLSDEYESIKPSLAQGSTLVRTIILEGIGVPAQLLPNLNLTNTEAFNVYPEKGVDKNAVKQGELLSQSIIKVTYLFNQAGKVTIPEIRLPWFNTSTGKEEYAILAPKDLEIQATTTTKPPIPSATKAPESISASTYQKSSSWSWILTVLFALAWILTLLLWFYSSHFKKSHKKNVKQRFKELESACLTNNPSKTREALIAWASTLWPEATILNLTDLSLLIQDASFKKQLQSLSQTLYEKGSKEAWQGQALLRALYTMKRDKIKDKKQPKLPPINPL